jgi:hypothetical protein
MARRGGSPKLQRDKADVVLVPDVSENNSNQRLVVEFAERAHLPTIASTRQFVTPVA